ncbi:family 78 glycoside hydrolase catalytic domain [Nocardia sp. NPDC023852]|uniref:alpha-L-rhamnosidase n=1 Tax=Nocardia sp. NPDC023852 TaxID=3154697 RepID=UPI0033DC1E9F
MSLTAIGLRTNGRDAPLGIDSPAPVFSWLPVADDDGAEQIAYAIEVSRSEHFGAEMVWRSGRVESALPFGVVYEGPALQSRCRYHWRVRLEDSSDGIGKWSQPAWFETGVLDPASWSAQWITAAPVTLPSADAAVYLRGSVELTKEVVHGRAYVSGLGWYRFFVNGRDLTGAALVPRWTPFDTIVEYQTYDVSENFRRGRNILALAIGDGRYRGRIGMNARRAVYGDRLAGFVQIELKLADGSTVTIVTGEGWHGGPGRIRASDPMHGEHIDLRVPDDDWLLGENPPARMSPVQVLAPASRSLVAEELPPVRVIDAPTPQTITRLPSGAQIVDFGQNIAGVVRIRLSGPEGSHVRLTHSELRTPDGELDLTYLDAPPFMKVAPQRDEVTLSGRDEWIEPWFTIHGFRYLQVDGLGHGLRPDDVRAMVLSTDLPVTGTFECSDERLNRLQRNVLWSLRSNFTDTPTDCPTRERSGWTGDIQVFAPTATLLVDAHGYLNRYLRNLALEQFPDGTVPPFVPSETSAFSGGPPRLVRITASAVGWGDVAAILPWTLYRYYGDTTVLRRQYDSMRRWIHHLERTARTKRSPTRLLRKRVGAKERYILDTGFHWGEWLRPGESFAVLARDLLWHRPVVATAYFAHSTMLMSRIAEVIGVTADARHYAELSEHVKDAWRSAFVRQDGRIGADHQDDYVRALAFDLLTPQQRPVAVERLAQLIEQSDHHVGTGFLSTPMILPVLADNGRAELAFHLLLQTTGPSWLHQIERGATTVWETWDAYDRNGKGKGSHNHYAFGAVAQWLSEGIAGITPAEPGYRVVRVQPLVGGGITHAAASITTPFGVARSSWRVVGELVELDVTIPPGAAGDIRLGDGRVERVGSGTHRFEWSAG